MNEKQTEDDKRFPLVTQYRYLTLRYDCGPPESLLLDEYGQDGGVVLNAEAGDVDWVIASLRQWRHERSCNADAKLRQLVADLGTLLGEYKDGELL